MKKANTFSGLINIRLAFLSEIGIGLSANTVLLLFHVLAFLLQHRLKPTDLIIGLMALTHLVMLIIAGFIFTDVSPPQAVPDDVKCKLVSYLQRFLRGLSICATCLFSVLQAVTLSPRSSHLAKFIHKAPHHSLCPLLALWVLYVPFSAHFSFSSRANVTSQGLLLLTESCFILPMTYFLRRLFTILGIFRDVLLLGLMALSSGYMVTLLHRHRRQSRHLRSPGRSPKASPEQRATRTILLLVSCFLVTYCLDSVISSSRLMWNNHPVYRWVQVIVSNGYGAISPLVFLTTDKRILNFFKSLGAVSA